MRSGKCSHIFWVSPGEKDVWWFMILSAHICKGDEGNALEAAGIWKSHEIKILNFSAIAPVISDFVLLKFFWISQEALPPKLGKHICESYPLLGQEWLLLQRTQSSIYLADGKNCSFHKNLDCASSY